MPTAVYLGNDRIQIVTGKVTRRGLKVKQAHSEPIPEGIIINGIITDEGWLRERLRGLKREHKLPRGKLDLVVDSGDLLTKTAVVPLVKEYKLKKLVAGEFAESVTEGQVKLYDYTVLCPKNPDGIGATILCAAADRAFVESYIDLFNGVNRNLRVIRLGLDCIISLCGRLTELKNKTYILLLPDGNALVSYLFVNGSYFFSQRSRLLEQRGTPQSAGELNQRVSYLTQFNKAQNSGGEITNIYLCGLSPEESGLAQELEQLCGLAVQSLPPKGIARKKSAGRYHPTNYCYTTGCLL